MLNQSVESDQQANSILTEEPQPLQVTDDHNVLAAEILARRTKRGKLNTEMDKQIGFCSGMESARDLIRKHDPKSPAIFLLSCEIVAAHKKWHELYAAWGETL